MRIEVGYGLEGILTDGMAGTILRTALAPRFKAGNYDRGIEGGVGAILVRPRGPRVPGSAGGRVRRGAGAGSSGNSTASTRRTCRGTSGCSSARSSSASSACSR